MQVVDDTPQETIHLYVFPEDQLPRKPEYPSIGAAIFAALCLLAILGISVFSAQPAGQDVSFTLTIQGYRLVPGILTRHIQVPATGTGHTPATSATGTITMYNGLAYTQIVPTGTSRRGPRPSRKKWMGPRTPVQRFRSSCPTDQSSEPGLAVAPPRRDL